MTELSQGLLDYHQRSKHRVNDYAPGPTGLDWANQPDPFREFHGAPQLKLPLAANSLATRYNELRQGDLPPACRFDLDHLATPSVWTNKKARRTRESNGLQRPVGRHGDVATTWWQCCVRAGRPQPQSSGFLSADLTDAETTCKL